MLPNLRCLIFQIPALAKVDTYATQTFYNLNFNQSNLPNVLKFGNHAGKVPKHVIDINYLYGAKYFIFYQSK